MGKRGRNRTAKASECTLKVPERASRTARGLFVISRSGAQVRPPAPAPPWGRSEYGGVPEWPKGTDCKSAGYAYGGSNPPAPTKKALISLKSRLFCNFSGRFAFQGMDGRSGEKQRQGEYACLRVSSRLCCVLRPENCFDPLLTHTRKN